MKQKTNRRNFFKNSAKAGLTGCALLMGSGAMSSEFLDYLIQEKEIDPKTLNYCGYTCPKDCLFNEATIKDDVELKKEAFIKWGIEERYGKKFDEEIAFCYGCKAEGKPEGVVVSECTVRGCCIEKGQDCCIECDELTSCDKDLWKRFPNFYEQVKEMQVKYKG